jgi:hypothetical protein
MKNVFFILIISIFLLSLNLHAAPNLINYQGTLTDSVGQPIDGDITIEFRLFDTETRGTRLWSETQSNVTVTKGAYNVLLGSSTPFPVDFFKNGSLWLEVVVAGETLSGRQRLVSSPFARYSEKASSVDWTGVASVPSDLADGDDVGLTTETDPTVNSLGKAGLICATNEFPVFNGLTWNCATETDPSVNALSKAALNCVNGQIVRLGDSGWECSTDSSTTYGNNITLTALTAQSSAGNYDSTTPAVDVYSLDGGSFNIHTENGMTTTENIIFSHVVTEPDVSYFRHWYENVNGKGEVDLYYNQGPSYGNFHIKLNGVFPVSISKTAPNEKTTYVETIELSVDWITVIDGFYGDIYATGKMQRVDINNGSSSFIISAADFEDINRNFKDNIYKTTSSQADMDGIYLKEFTNKDAPSGKLVMKDLIIDAGFMNYWYWYETNFLAGQSQVDGTWSTPGTISFLALGGGTNDETYSDCFPTKHQGFYVNNGFIGFRHVEMSCEAVTY